MVIWAFLAKRQAMHHIHDVPMDLAIVPEDKQHSMRFSDKVLVVLAV